MEKEKLEKQIKELQRATEGHDNEVAHSIFDDIAFEIAGEYEPVIMKRLRKITENVLFGMPKDESYV